MGSDRLYRLESGYLLDWHLFRRLRSRGESHGPAGVKDLRAAIELVRGVPLDGAERAYAAGARNPFTWLSESDIYPGHVSSAIVDTAHQLAELYLDAGDTAGARWAVQRAWLTDPHRGDDEPWHDLMRAASAEGHTAELRNLLRRAHAGTRRRGARRPGPRHLHVATAAAAGPARCQHGSELSPATCHHTRHRQAVDQGKFNSRGGQ